MATGDKNILAFANKDSLQHKQTRAYSAGAICIKDALFYEANSDIPENTTFTEGDAGATWKLIGGKSTEDWVASYSYKVGDQVFALEALWECKTAHTSGSSFSKTNWDLKAGLVNGEYWTQSGDVLEPKTRNVNHIGSDNRHLEQIHSYSQYIHSTDGTAVGILYGRDSSNISLSGASKDLHIGYATSADDMTFKSGNIDINKEVRSKANHIITSGNELQFRDGDGDTGWEGVYFYTSSNDLKIYGSLNNKATTYPSMTITYQGEPTFHQDTTFDTNITVDGSIYANSTSSVLGGTGLSSRFDKVRTRHITVYTSGSTSLWGYISCNSSGDMVLESNKGNNVFLKNKSSEEVYMSGSGSFRPTTDSNDQYLGSSSERWEALYASTSTINTSDAREKYFTEFPDKLLDVWFDFVKPMAYQWKKQVEKKGSEARIHAGVVAQDVIRAFMAADLDWTRYGVVCADFHNSQSDTNIIPDEFDPTDIDNLPPLMVRYDHVQVIEMAAIRRKLGV